jgi:N-acyl-D-amino-acid deacylase
MTPCCTLIISMLALAGSVAVLGQQAGAGLLIRNGRLIDGTGSPSSVADLRIDGDTIVEIAPVLAPKAGERVIDAAGRVVAPGFIDMHSHVDGGLEESPDAATQLRQGITTALVGQDGGGDLPVADLTDRMARVAPTINLATSVGHGTVRRLVMGEDFKRAATPAEIETMKALVARGMKDGAVGLSSGLEYDPGFYATTDELVALASAIKPFGGIYSSHVRDEENEYLAAWKEAIDVGRRAGVAVEISHMKLASKPVWGRARDGLAVIEAARREGLTVMGDWYPYPYWQSAIYVLIPDRDFENVEKWRVGLDEIGGAGNVRITNYRADPSWDGKTLAELAEAQNLDAPSLIVRMVKAAGPGIGIIGTSMVEADMKAILAHPQVLICSDGQLAGRHPRGYGAFPRVLGRYVREQQVITLEEAIAKMTSRPAAMLGLADRGALAPGKKADIVIFDPATIADRGTPLEPAQAPVGVDTVIVNGQVVLDAAQVTSARPGRALRRGASYR